MDGLALKLVLTPTLIGAVSLAGRRWGPGVSGWLVGFPLTSGPVAFFLALDQGVAFAAGAAAGSMTGAAAQAAFCVLYGRWARGHHWAVPLVAGSLAFAVASVALQLVTLALLPLVALVIGALVVALRFMPRDADSPRPAQRPRWDIPARIVVTTTIVLLLTGLATALGPSLTGCWRRTRSTARSCRVSRTTSRGQDPPFACCAGSCSGSSPSPASSSCSRC